MPLFSLLLKGTFENVKQVEPSDGKIFLVKLKCTHCGDTSDRETGLDLGAEKVEIPDSRGVASLVQKCSFCNQKMVIDVPDDGKGVLIPDDEDPAEVLQLECRGCEPESWSPGDGWVVTGPSDTRFEEADFSDEWAEYDEGAEAMMTGMDFECSVDVTSTKGKKGKKGKK